MAPQLTLVVVGSTDVVPQSPQPTGRAPIWPHPFEFAGAQGESSHSMNSFHGVQKSGSRLTLPFVFSRPAMGPT